MAGAGRDGVERRAGRDGSGRGSGAGGQALSPPSRRASLLSRSSFSRSGAARCAARGGCCSAVSDERPEELSVSRLEALPLPPRTSCGCSSPSEESSPFELRGPRWSRRPDGKATAATTARLPVVSSPAEEVSGARSRSHALSSPPTHDAIGALGSRSADVRFASGAASTGRTGRLVRASPGLAAVGPPFGSLRGEEPALSAPDFVSNSAARPPCRPSPFPSGRSKAA